MSYTFHHEITTCSLQATSYWHGHWTFQKQIPCQEIVRFADVTQAKLRNYLGPFGTLRQLIKRTLLPLRYTNPASRLGSNMAAMLHWRPRFSGSLGWISIQHVPLYTFSTCHTVATAGTECAGWMEVPAAFQARAVYIPEASMLLCSVFFVRG